ncbi:hypothetical protein ACFVVL_34770 [Kitasatospora sp. NPDC058115]|uniref:hypothetical protein n=1 Tax=Kitasatospora sp. NPDC058115 TaxID=3346347 RepID=UPI0036DB01E4
MELNASADGQEEGRDKAAPVAVELSDGEDRREEGLRRRLRWPRRHLRIFGINLVRGAGYACGTGLVAGVMWWIQSR